MQENKKGESAFMKAGIAGGKKGSSQPKWKPETALLDAPADEDHDHYEECLKH